MLWLRIRQRILVSCLSGLSVLGLASASAQAQTVIANHRPPVVVVPAGPDCPIVPGATATDPRLPTVPTDPNNPTAPGSTQAPTAPSMDLSYASLASSRGGAESASLGTKGGAYIDSAIPQTMFRLRYDSAYDNNRPDRAEYFYAKCGCFKTAGIDPSAPGPLLPEKSVDYQDITSYLEVAFNNRMSAFVEIPIRFLNPEVNENTAGLADMFVGFKYALLAENCRWLSFQLRANIPTGDADRGLGINIVRLEPALLYLNQVTDRFIFQAELRDSIPIDGTDFAGNVLRYGIGLSYDIYQSERTYVEPVAEMVGWSVLSGRELTAEGDNVSAAGDFILNAKLGCRVGVGSNGSLYFGYARALTGAVWYKEAIRAEFRWIF